MALARSRDAHGSTTLHAAAARGHRDVVQLLLQHDADPNARDVGDNATPLHFAAGGGHVDVVRALLDAGANVHGYGDIHEADIIGWATVLAGPNDAKCNVLPLLLERGAQHHIFSAIATGDLTLIRGLAEDNPEALDRRMSRFEHGQTPLHFAISRQRHDILDLVIDLGADLEAQDRSGRTALEAAMMRGDKEAMRRLHDAGATTPRVQSATDFSARMAALSKWKLGIAVSERTVPRYLQGRPKARSQTWRTFFANHLIDLAFMPHRASSVTTGDDVVADASGVSFRPVPLSFDNVCAACQLGVVDCSRSRRTTFLGARVAHDHVHDRSGARNRTGRDPPRHLRLRLGYGRKGTCFSSMPTSALCGDRPL